MEHVNEMDCRTIDDEELVKNESTTCSVERLESLPRSIEPRTRVETKRRRISMKREVAAARKIIQHQVYIPLPLFLSHDET